MGPVAAPTATGPGEKLVPPAGYDPAFPAGKAGVLVHLDDEGTREVAHHGPSPRCSQALRRRALLFWPRTWVSVHVGAVSLLVHMIPSIKLTPL